MQERLWSLKIAVAGILLQTMWDGQYFFSAIDVHANWMYLAMFIESIFV